MSQEAEIAYGHHRLVALNELKIEEIDIPIRPLTDAQMIQIMANENLDNWKTSPAVIMETVLVAKQYLDKELKKHKNWEAADKNIRRLIDNEGNFAQSKKHGVGRDTILKFLGSNWKGWVVQDALNTIKEVKEKKVSKKAVDEMPSTAHSKEFKTAATKVIRTLIYIFMISLSF